MFSAAADGSSWNSRPIARGGLSNNGSCSCLVSLTALPAALGAGSCPLDGLGTMTTPRTLDVFSLSHFVVDEYENFAMSFDTIHAAETRSGWTRSMPEEAAIGKL